MIDLDLQMTNLNIYDSGATCGQVTNGTANIRDVSGWYHFMFNWITPIENDRVNLY